MALQDTHQKSGASKAQAALALAGSVVAGAVGGFSIAWVIAAVQAVLA